MTPMQFKAVIADIERNLDPGEGYTLDILLKNGMCIIDIAHGPNIADSVIVLSRPDMPPFYLDVEQIAAITLHVDS